MPKREKNCLQQNYQGLNSGPAAGEQIIDISTLLAENASLRNLAAEILLQSDLLREKLHRRDDGRLH